jgi:hypothetical protein
MFSNGWRAQRLASLTFDFLSRRGLTKVKLTRKKFPRKLIRHMPSVNDRKIYPVSPMKTPHLVCFLSAILLAPLFGLAQDVVPAQPPSTSPAPPATVDYAKQVRPIFEKYCYQCHGNGQSKGGVRLDLKEKAMMHITAGNPVRSDVYRSITRSLGASDRMPPVSKDQPKDGDVAIIKLWIEQGADWPEVQPK